MIIGSMDVDQRIREAIRRIHNKIDGIVEKEYHYQGNSYTVSFKCNVPGVTDMWVDYVMVTDSQSFRNQINVTARFCVRERGSK